MRAGILAVGLALLAVSARAADKPLYAQIPSWVKAIPIPDAVAGADQGPLLQVSQARFSESGDEVYDERAYRIQEPGDLQRLGNIVLTWQPDTETLVIHKLEIIRDGKVIDQLDEGGKVQILHRETNLEAAMFDGALTATVQLEGLQVGDVVHLAVTRRMHDAVLKGHSQLWSGLARPGKIGRAYISASWPNTKPLHWQASPGMAAPKTASGKDGGSLVIDQSDAEAPLSPRGAPARFATLAYVQMSDFGAWSEVSTLMAPLFAKASTLEPNSPLKAEIARIKAQSSDPKAQAAAALKLVEERIRYLFVGLNNGNLIPAVADETWRRRFGDCKAKTALLVALLEGLGIQAQPALVDTRTGDALPGRLPSVEAFDHVAVKATIAGKTYWLDGTRLGDGGIDTLETPNYHWMLPVQASGAQLEALKPPPFADPHFITRLDLDASAGLDAPAKAHGEHRWLGDGAQGVRLKLQSMSVTERERAMRGYWQQAEPSITAGAVTMDDDGRSIALVMDGTTAMSWGADTRGRTFVVTDSGVGGDINFQRQPGPNADAPFALEFPSYTRGTIKVTLPDKGQGFMLINGAAIDQTVAGAHYHRTAKIENGAAVIDIEVRAIEPEFSFAEASTAAVTLRNWSMHAVMIASNPALASAQGAAGVCLTGASDEALKACQTLLPQMATLGGDTATVYFSMGRAYAGKRDPASAFEYISKALALRPDYAEALAARGVLLADRNDLAGADADLGRAVTLAPNNSYIRRLRTNFYLARDDLNRAIADADKAIELDPKDAEMFVARGLARRRQQDFVRAMSDYDEALKLDANALKVHAYKGDLLYTQKDYEKAEREFDRAIALEPKVAIYRMGRALARAAQKHFTEAVADYSEAIQLQPANARFYRNRAVAYRELGKLALASADEIAADRLEPPAAVARAAPAPLIADQIRMLLTSGRAHSRDKEYDKAIADFDQALKIVARHPDVLTERGKAYAAQHQWDRALADFDQALKVRPNDSEVMAARSAALDQLSRTNPAPRLAVGAATGGPDVTGSVSDLMADATTAMARKDYEAAIKNVTAALKLRPRSPALLKARAEAYRAAGHFSFALADYDGLVDLDPADASLVLARGQLDVLDRRWDNAISDFSLALRMNKALGAAYRGRAAAYEAKMQLDLALADYDDALRIDPKDLEAIKRKAQVQVAKAAAKQAQPSTQ